MRRVSSLMVAAMLCIALVALGEQVTLRVSSTDGGRVVNPGEGTFTYDYCTKVELRAEANRGYRFVGWTGDTYKLLDPKAAYTTIDSMVDDFEIKAVFQATTHRLVLSSSEGGRVVKPGEGTFTYEHCTKVELRAEAEPGYRFAGWTGDIDRLADPNSPHTTLDSMVADFAIRAAFHAVTHTLIVSSSEGGKVVVPGEGTFTYEHCTKVELRAEAAPGFSFVRWTGDVGKLRDPKAPNTTIDSMSDDYKIRAVFERIMHVLSVSSTGHGRVTVPGEGQFAVGYCSEVELVAKANPGYRFARWAGDIGEIDDPLAAHTSIRVRGNYTIQAVFEKQTHRLTVSSTHGGHVAVPGEGVFTFEHCTKVDLRAEADCGYRFVEWTGDIGNLRDPKAQHTVIDSMLDDYEVVAVFERKFHTLTISSDPCGEVVSPGEGRFTLQYCSIVPLKAEMDCGYTFARWTGDVETVRDRTSPDTTVEMLGDYRIRAEFNPPPPPPIPWWLFVLGAVVGGLVVFVAGK